MTRTSDTVRTHLQRCRTLGEGLLKLCAHQSPYTGCTHRLFPPPQAASVRPRFEPTATPPSRVISRGCYRYANPPPRHLPVQPGNTYVRTYVASHLLRMRIKFPDIPGIPCYERITPCLNVTTTYCPDYYLEVYGSTSIVSIRAQRSVHIRCPASSLFVSGTQISQHYRDCSCSPRLDGSLPDLMEGFC